MGCEAANAAALRRYYRIQAGIYDASRWAFLFGRDAIIEAAARHTTPRAILEAGCGTGRNLAALRRRFPAARLTGVDLSADMLGRAERKLARSGARAALVEAPYAAPLAAGGYDLVLFSYSLSMMNPGWDQAIEAARADLAPAGAIAVVDFHATPVTAFRRWMAFNHVRMESHLLPGLERRFMVRERRIVPVYGGLWTYLVFVGTVDTKRPSSP